MKAPRTPGPWNVSEGHTLTITAEGVDVATVDAPRDRYAEGVANAYLIASAPELLEALEECYGFAALFNHDTDASWALAQRRILSAIAKAKGESQ